MKHRKLSSALLAAALSAAMLVSLLPAAVAAEGDIQLTIIGTSDTHGNIWGYSYEDMKESTKDGLARISTYVTQVRAENPNTILVDTGDTIQGTIMTDDLYSKGQADHPVPAAMNYMAYDAWTLGNHEFNWGVDNLKGIMAQSNAPVLAANIKNADGTLFTGNAYTIVEKGGVKVAVIGVDTPNIPRWDGTKQGVADLKFEPMADAVADAIQDIGGKADVIMVCAHAGYEAEYSADGSDAAKTILEKNPDVDILQMGHTHTTYINNDGIPMGETKNNAGEVVRYDLTLSKDKTITSAAVETVSMADVAPDQGLRDVPSVKKAQEETVSFIQDNVLGHAAADFQPANEIKGIPAGRIMDTAVMDLIGKIQLENSGADVTGAALFKDTSDLKKGELNYGNVFDIYKFPNVLYTVKVTGAELKAYMEWAAACYNTWTPGDINISFNPAKPGYLHDHFTGLEYEINLSKPEGSRIENVMFKGKALADDAQLTLCVNDYRFSGLKTAGIISGEKEWESSASVRDMIVAYLAEHDPLEPAVDNNWSITGVDLQLSSAEREKLVKLVNAGQLETPYGKSLNLNDETVKAVLAKVGNVTVDGDAVSVDRTVIDGVTYYRLRDLAVALTGTPAAFNVSWNNGVALAKGGEYADKPLSLVTGATKALTTQLTATVDGAAVTVPAANVIVGEAVDGNYYVTAEGVTDLLGVAAEIADGVLTITTK